MGQDFLDTHYTRLVSVYVCYCVCVFMYVSVNVHLQGPDPTVKKKTVSNRQKTNPDPTVKRQNRIQPSKDKTGSDHQEKKNPDLTVNTRPDNDRLD